MNSHLKLWVSRSPVFDQRNLMKLFWMTNLEVDNSQVSSVKQQQLRNLRWPFGFCWFCGSFLQTLAVPMATTDLVISIPKIHRGSIISTCIQSLLGGWINPFEKYAEVKLDQVPQGSGWKQKIFETTTYSEKMWKMYHLHLLHPLWGSEV